MNCSLRRCFTIAMYPLSSPTINISST
uniref:Uncharacterized protein n=1 Tax=Arundo donax TaxID=35708 RepID=A0A0A9FIT5_ARUDO